MDEAPTRRRGLLVLAAAVLAVLIAAPAHATNITTKKAIWGPAERAGMPQFPVYADLGVGIWQDQLQWNAVAPTRPADPTDSDDPAYRWPADLDSAVRQSRQTGIKISLQVLYTPPWANGGQGREFAPTDPQDYADFMIAAAKRYPTVHFWMVWSEPTRPDRYQPMALNSKPDVQRYAVLLDDAYGALKSVSPANKVIGGNTFTAGTPGPIRFIARLRLPDGRPPRMDYYGHNPFSARTPNLRSSPLPRPFADFSDLDELARFIDRNLSRKRQHHLKLFLSEYCAPTDHPNNEFNFYVDRDVQARWLSNALGITRRFDRIFTLGVFAYDDQPDAAGDEVNRGLMTWDGQKKPSYAAMKDG